MIAGKLRQEPADLELPKAIDLLDLIDLDRAIPIFWISPIHLGAGPFYSRLPAVVWQDARDIAPLLIIVVAEVIEVLAIAVEVYYYAHLLYMRGGEQLGNGLHSAPLWY